MPIEFVGGQIVENVACVTAEQYILASDSALRFIGDVVVDPIVFFISVGKDTVFFSLKKITFQGMCH